MGGLACRKLVGVEFAGILPLPLLLMREVVLDPKLSRLESHRVLFVLDVPFRPKAPADSPAPVPASNSDSESESV